MGSNAPGVKLVIYKKIVEGDLSKFTATSNVTPSGGGARDLRFSPAKEFFPVFQKLFPLGAEQGTLHGLFFWPNHNPTEATVHSPTNARPTEVRIGCIHECFPAQYIPSNSRDCVLLLIMDADNKVWPFFTSEHSLEYDDWHPDIKKHILGGLRAKRGARITAMGYIDFEAGRSYTNGQ